MIGPTGRVTGVDPAFNMMAKGRERLKIGFVQGVGERLPFSDCRFDAITMGYALRHVPDLDQAFGEYRRVLRPGGLVVLLEITKPASPIGMALARMYFVVVVPCITWLATRSADAAHLMQFYWQTIRQCVPPETIIASLRRSGFDVPERTVVHGIFSEYTAVRSR